MALAAICSFWLGSALGPIHAACLRSFVRNGHRVTLFTYEPLEDCPAGVEVVPAAEIMARAELAEYGAPKHQALLSDVFRYRLLAASAGLWVDADCYCIKPIEDDDYIFGLETVGRFNSAVLKLPAGSELLQALCAIRPGFIPPWFGRVRQSEMRLKRSLGVPKRLERMNWGTIGPTALTHYVKQFGLTHLAVPSDTFYPLHWDHIDRLLEPELQLSELITHRTTIFHLYSSALHRVLRGPIAENAPLAALLADETAIAPIPYGQG